MRPSAAPESDHGDGAPARDRGAARPSGALTQVPSTAPNPQIPPRAPRSALAPLTLRPTPAAALVQPGRACTEPADRPVQARAGWPCRCRLAPAPAPEGPTPPCCPASLLVALDRCGQTADLSHASHPRRASPPSCRSLAAKSPPPAAVRPARAGTRRAARPRPRPCARVVNQDPTHGRLSSRHLCQLRLLALKVLAAQAGKDYSQSTAATA